MRQLRLAMEGKKVEEGDLRSLADMWVPHG